MFFNSLSIVFVCYLYKHTVVYIKHILKLFMPLLPQFEFLSGMTVKDSLPSFLSVLILGLSFYSLIISMIQYIQILKNSDALSRCFLFYYKEISLSQKITIIIACMSLHCGNELICMKYLH